MSIESSTGDDAMARRYVFWRDSTGRPDKRPGDHHAPRALLAEIGKGASVTDEGSVQWQGMWWLRFDHAIKAAFVVVAPDGDELNSHDAWLILRSSVVKCIRAIKGNKPVVPSEVLERANEAAAAFFRRKPAPYMLVSSLSVATMPAKRIKSRDCEVAWLRKPDLRYPLPRELQVRWDRSPIGEHVEKTKYKTIRVKTTGRSIHEATGNALDALHLLRGYWNLFATLGSWSRSLGSRLHKPMGVVHAGPVHTLHHPDGRLVDGAEYWYEPDFSGDFDLFKPKKGWDMIEKNRRWAMARVRRLSYRHELEQLLVRYAMALDQSNPDIAFLNMWSILEHVTDTIGASYDKTIKRTLWPYNDRDIGKELLESLRFRRNRFVHSSKSDGDNDQVAYLMKSFVDQHLLHLIRNDFNVASLKDYAQHLELPTSIDSLDTQRRQRVHALKILRTWKAKT